MLREMLAWQLGAGGSPVTVASVMSLVIVDRSGKGPAPGSTSALAQLSLAGGTACTACAPIRASVTISAVKKPFVARRVEMNTFIFEPIIVAANSRAGKVLGTAMSSTKALLPRSIKRMR